MKHIKSEIKEYGLSLLSAILCVLSFPPFGFSYLIWFALVPILLVITTTKSVKSTQNISRFFGLLFYGVALLWFYSIFKFFAIALWFLLTIYLMIYFRFLRYVISRFKSRFTILWAGPILWVAVEFFRAEWTWLKFSWLSLGYTQHSFPVVLQFASILGVHGISFLIVLVNCFLIFVIQNYSDKKAVAKTLGVLLLLALCVSFYGIKEAQRSYKTNINVALIQNEKGGFQKYYSYADAIRSPVDLIVFPEYTLSEFLEENEGHLSLLKNLTERKNSYVVIGSKMRTGKESNSRQAVLMRKKGYSEEDINSLLNFYNTAFTFSPKGDIIGRSVKANPIQFFSDGLPAKSFDIVNTKHGKMGVQICYDMDYSYVSRKLVKNGAEFLVIPTFDALGWGKVQHLQHSAMTPLRAVENQRFIVRVASSGISQIITPVGKVVEQLPFAYSGYIIGKIGVVMEKSIYTQYGYLFPYLCLLILFGVMIGALIEMVFCRKSRQSK